MSPHPIRAVIGAGSVNHVFVIGSGQERWVIRFARDPLDDDVFEAEAWSAAQSATLGVPTPPVTAVGDVHGIPYSVQLFVEGHPVSGEPGAVTASTTSMWSTLGHYGQSINSVQPDRSAPAKLFTRFGRDLEQAWASHLGYHLERLDGHDPLLHDGVLTRKQQLALRDTVLELGEVPLRFGLSHGDLTPRNLIQPEAGPPVLIDWGSASFGPVPWSDLLNIDRDARLSGLDAAPRLDAFLNGMGLQRNTLWSTFETFRRVQLLDLVRWATDRRPDRVEAAMNDLVATLQNATEQAARTRNCVVPLKLQGNEHFSRW